MWRNHFACLAAALFCVAAASLSAFVTEVQAQSYPTRPINVIYNNSPGSGPDVLGRLYAIEAGKILGQPVIYENRTGANGRLAMAALKSSPGDAHVLALVSDGLVISQPIVDSEFRIEPGKDYEAVSILFESPFMLVSSPSVPFRDLNGFVAYAKKNPGKINFAMTAGASSQFLAERFMRAVNVDVTLIPYKGGEAGVVATLGGQTEMLFSTSTAKPHVDAGKLVALVTTGRERWKLLPAIPTLQESGVAFSASVSYPLMAPLGTPKDVLLKINRAFDAASRLPDVVKKTADIGYTSLASMTPDESSRFIRSEIEAWTPIIRKAGIKMQ